MTLFIVKILIYKYIRVLKDTSYEPRAARLWSVNWVEQQILKATSYLTLSHEFMAIIEIEKIEYVIKVRLKCGFNYFLTPTL